MTTIKNVKAGTKLPEGVVIDVLAKDVRKTDLLVLTRKEVKPITGMHHNAETSISFEYDAVAPWGACTGSLVALPWQTIPVIR
jgi:hypothetical protein